MKQVIYHYEVVDKNTWLEKRVILELNRNARWSCPNCGLEFSGNKYFGTRCQECGEEMEVE